MAIFGTVVPGETFGFRNRIINGDMRIDQRNAGAAVTVSDQYTLDRWSAFENTDGTFTVQRSSTAPTGFSNSLLATITSADSSLTTNQQCIPCRQWIEGTNIVDLAWGTASAKTVTFSFWVRGSVTGTYGITISNNAGDVVYAATYTISAANTFEYKTITIPGPTSGTWPTDNGRGMIVTWSLGAGPSVTVSSNNSWVSSPGSAVYAAVGQTNVCATNGATWFLTGVQLEVGNVATPFERRPYGTELALCQRYFYRNQALNSIGGNPAFSSGVMYQVDGFLGYTQLPVTMRAAPSFSVNSAGSFSVIAGNNGYTATLISAETTPNSARVSATPTSNLTLGHGAFIQRSSGQDAKMDFSAEL